jgi:hypothetical protein
VSAIRLHLEDLWLERPQGTRTARRTLALINTSGFSFFWAERRPDARVVECRRVVCSIERRSSATPERRLSMEAVGYPGLAGAPGSMPLLISLLVFSESDLECRIYREMADHDGLRLCLFYGCRLYGAG